MATQRSVSRSVEVRAAPARAWRAFSDPALLGRWLGVALAVDVRPGSIGLAGDRVVRVEQVEEVARLTFTWWPLADDGEPASRVELALAPSPAGTRVTVVETVLADLPEAARPDLEAAAR